MKKAIEWINAAMLLVMLLITVSQIVFRSILRISASWSEELAQYSFAFLVFVGAITVTRDESHITIGVIIDRLSSGWRRLLRSIGRLLTMIFLAIFSLGAIQNMRATWDAELPTAEWMKIGYMYLVLLVSGVLMMFYLAVNLVRDLAGKAPLSAEVSAEARAGGVS